MFIYSRSIMADRNRIMEATVGAVEVAALVSGIIDNEVAVYGSRFGEPINGIRWSMRVESQAELEAMTAKLLANEDYIGWVTTNSGLFETAATDNLVQVVSSSLAAKPKRYYTLLVANAINGRVGDAVAFGVRTQQFVAEATGLSTAFTVGTYGSFGTVGWLTGADAMGELDALAAMQFTNAEYQALVAESADLFQQGSGMIGLIERLN